MATLLIIPDIHLKWRQADKILEAYSFDKVVFLGDFFDDWYDTPEKAKEMAIWVKSKIDLYGDKAIFLFSNHDIAYAFPWNFSLGCSGFTREKALAINSVLTRKDWLKFKLHYFEDGILYSHAGCHPYVFCGSQDKELTLELIDKKCKAALEDASMGIPNVVTSAGMGRGGWQPVGGVTWMDWNLEFEPISGLNQCVGHTPAKKVRIKKGKNSVNYCFDTNLAYYGIIRDGRVTIKKV